MNKDAETVTGITKSPFEHSFLNSIYLAKIPDHGSTSVMQVFAKCFSSLDERPDRTISITIWSTTLRAPVKDARPY